MEAPSSRRARAERAMKPMHKAATDPADVYREQAGESRKEEAKSESPRAKLHWHQLARKWLSIAEEVARGKRR
jgi:hypothetical protein